MNVRAKERLLAELEEYTQVTRDLVLRDRSTQFASNQPLDPEANARIFQERLASDSKSRIYNIARLLESLEAKNALSVACGMGHKEVMLLTEINRLSVYGIDFAHHSLKTAHTEAQHRQLPLFLTTGDVVHLPYRKDSFDAVFSLAVMEHIYDIKRFHDEIYRVLRPGGVYFGGAANYWGILMSMGRRKMASSSLEEDTILRRLKVLMRLIPKYIRGLQGEYTQKLPFNEFRYGVDHIFVRSIMHPLDPCDLHATNPFEIHRLLKLSNFTNVKTWGYYNQLYPSRRLITAVFGLPIVKLLGPSITAIAFKPEG